MLGVQRLAQHGVAAVYANPIAWNVGGGEKREPHDVVPVRVRHKYIEGVFSVGAVLPKYPVAEFAHARAEIADHIFVAAGNDLHTAGIAAERAAYRKWQPAVYEGIDRLLGLERMAASGEQRIADLGADRPLSQRCRQRAAGAPKADTQRPDRFGFGTGDRPLRSRRGLPGR